MAQTSYRAMTQSATMPLLSALSGRTVMMPQIDNPYVPGVSPDSTNNPIDRGVAQIYYCHNVMPSTYGYQSVGYNVLYPGKDGVRFQKIRYIQATTDKLSTYVAYDYEVSQTIQFLQSDGTWAPATNSPTGLTYFNQVSVATVNGVSYICVANIGTFTYDLASNTLTQVTLTGINDGTNLGILSANGYLICWSQTGVVWSATNDPLDFTPSDVTGAGGGDVQEAKGPIVWCQSTSYGFIIYTTKNAVSVTYSGNSTYPFNFKDLGGSGGLADSDLVSQETTGTQYAYTTNGIQKIFHTGATTFLPSVTDFLAGKVFEDFDETTLKFTITELTNTMRKKVTLISDRYLVLSYGISSSAMFTHALIFDIVATRMGKVKIQHNAAFEIQNLDPEVKETPRDSIAFLNENGQVSTLDFNTMSEGSYGVALFGKYQLIRTRKTQLDQVNIENTESNLVLNCYDMITYDGKTFVAAPEGYLLTEGTQTKTYLFSAVAENHTICLVGAFNVISIELYVNQHGRL